jgi:hypothetical protein
MALFYQRQAIISHHSVREEDKMKACANGALGAGTDVYHENIFDWRLGVSSPISVNKKGEKQSFSPFWKTKQESSD